MDRGTTELYYVFRSRLANWQKLKQKTNMLTNTRDAHASLGEGSNYSDRCICCNDCPFNPSVFCDAQQWRRRLACPFLMLSFRDLRGLPVRRQTDRANRVENRRNGIIIEWRQMNWCSMLIAKFYVNELGLWKLISSFSASACQYIGVLWFANRFWSNKYCPSPIFVLGIMTLNCLHRVLYLLHFGTNDISGWSAVKQQLSFSSTWFNLTLNDWFISAIVANDRWNFCLVCAILSVV